MKTSWERIRIGLAFMGLIIVLAVIGYRYLGAYEWLDAIWMVVVTISSVGFAERSQLDADAKLFTVFVIVFGMSAAAYTFGGFIQLLTEGELERILGRRRMTRGIERLKDHVIVCGFGRIGQELADQLARRNVEFLVIDNDAMRIDEAKLLNYLCVEGDATEDDILVTSGVGRATTLVTALPSDAANVFITLTSRNLNPDIQIIARADHPSTAKKLRQAGADKVVLPTLIGAQKMARMITRPVTADLMDLVTEHTFLDVDLDELPIPQDSQLVGVTVRETEAHRRHRLLVVGVKKENGEIVFNPDADYKFCIHDILVLMGRMEDIERFRDVFLG